MFHFFKMMMKLQNVSEYNILLDYYRLYPHPFNKVKYLKKIFKYIKEKN